MSTSDYDTNLRFSVIKSFSVIEKHLFWRGRVKRENLRSELGLSESSANLALRAYLKMYPGTLVRNGKIGYCPAPGFVPRHYKPVLSDCGLQQVEACIPYPDPPLELLAVLSKSVQERRFFEFDYTNASGEQAHRSVQPLAIVNGSGFPPLLHAWCSLRKTGRNFDFAFMMNARTGEKIQQSETLVSKKFEFAVPEGKKDIYGDSIEIDVPEACLLRTKISLIGNPHLWPRDIGEEIKKIMSQL
jgi:hypothetical protein